MTRINRLAGGVAALALCISMIAGAEAGGLKDGPPSPPAPKKWLPWVEGGGYLSTEQHRGEASLFAPIWQSSVALMFFQGTGRVFEDDIEEGNFALGFRQMTGSGWNFGLWAGYDVRNTEIDNTFHQVSFGFEALSDRWDVRANGYVAVSDPEASPALAQVFLSGNTIFMTGGEEVPLSGFDGEVGYKLFGSSGHGGGWGLKDGPAYQGRSHELRVYAGGYYFDDDDALDEVAGAKARVEWRIDDVIAALPGSRLTFEGEVRYDDVRDDQWEGGVRLRIPFGGGGTDARATLLASLTAQERRMTEGLERDVDIVTTVSKEEKVFDVLTGVRFDRAEVVEGGSDLQGALDGNGANSLIVLDGDTTSGSFTVGPSQTLQGGGSTIQVTGVKSGVTKSFTAPGSKPFLEQTLNQAVVTVDSDTHLAGLGIQGGGPSAGFDNHGIQSAADGVSNVAITDTTIRNTAITGINFTNDHNKILISRTSVEGSSFGIIFGLNNRNIALQTVDVSDIVAIGIGFAEGNSDVTLQDVTTSNTGLEGIVFDSNNSGLKLTNVLVDGTGAAGNGIRFADGNSDVTMENVTVRNAANDGIQFNDNNSNVTISDTSIENIGDRGIHFNDNNSNITISDTSIENTGDHGIRFNNNNSNVAISHTTIANVSSGGSDGVFFNVSNSGVTISDNTISTVAGAGIVIVDLNTDVTVSDNTISNTSVHGVEVSNGNSNVTVSGNTISNTGLHGVLVFENNSNVTVSGNTISNTTFDGVLFLNDNTNLTLSDNTFSGIGRDVFDFNAAGNTLLAGSTGNATNDAPGVLLCDGAGNFTGTLQITDQNGVVQTFVNGC